MSDKVRELNSLLGFVAPICMCPAIEHQSLSDRVRYARGGKADIRMQASRESRICIYNPTLLLLLAHAK